MSKKLGDGVTISFDAITVAQVIDISGPSATVESVDTTTLDNTKVTTGSGAGTGVIGRTFIPGPFDGGEVSLTIMYDSDDAYTAHLILTDNIGELLPVAIVIGWTATAADNWDFSGFITSFSPSASIGTMQTADVTIKVTADINLP